LGQQAALLDPLNPATQNDLSLMFYLNSNLAEAERSARRALQLAPGGAGYHCILAWSLIKQGRLSEAEAQVGLDSDAIERPLTYGLLALARDQSGVAREKLTELEEIARKDSNLADLQNAIAWIAVGLGEKDRPFAALAKARDSRDPSNAWLRSSPYLDPLHSDPRWDALLHKVGLADDQLK
jgi:Flp pilus assembly protein TadD